MKYGELTERLSSLEDVNYYGFSWNDSDLKLLLKGPGTKNYEAVICHWAHSLVVNLNWGARVHRCAGPLLSQGGSLTKESENELVLLVDFGSSGFISLSCSDITLVNK